MSTAQQIAISPPDPAEFFAEICAAYVEVLAGLRRPEQLARWLSDTAYFDICQRYRREARAIQVTGLNERPDIVLRRTRPSSPQTAPIKVLWCYRFRVS